MSPIDDFPILSRILPFTLLVLILWIGASLFRRIVKALYVKKNRD